MTGFLKGLAWSILVVALFFGVAVASYFSGQTVGHLTVSWASAPVRGAVAIAGVLLVTWTIRVKLNKRPWAGMALPRPQLGRLFLGCVCGAATILAVCAVEYEMGWLHVVRISTEVHRGLAKPLMVAIQLIPSLGTGFSEELAFRGYIFQTFGERTPIWVAALATGLLFALMHFSLAGFSIGFVLSVVLISTTFIIMRFATGSLWFPIGFHALYDWTQTYLVGLAPPPGYDPAVVQIHQSGPALWVGGAQLEFGLLDVSSILVVTVLVLVYGWHTRRIPSWTRRLVPDGRAAA